MKSTKIATLFDYVKDLNEDEIDQIISFVLGIAPDEEPTVSVCPHCRKSHIVKYGRNNGRQRYLCRDCHRTFTSMTNTLLEQSHFQQPIWSGFIKDTISGATLDECATKYGFSHQTAFNMRHKMLIALQNMLENEPTILSGIAEFDETFVLDCYKGKRLPKSVARLPRKHGAKATKRGISREYIAICTGIQRGGQVFATTVNRAKPSAKEIQDAFHGHIKEDTLVLTDGLTSYRVLEKSENCTILDVGASAAGGAFNLNTVNGLHSYIKNAYNRYRGVATKYINRYNALFSLAYRCSSAAKDALSSTLCSDGRIKHWHGIKDIASYRLVAI